ncbi:hypothetical protein BDY21DRAFT_333120 [Lineolata rhizophorae]|uniref:Uncharacterized protein n=1 Tax=Lineolata rhizophorae TaxID=578093 RepID=A0A6A6PD47_9PEZI|nr:hypothetical protein BDY21DRAFT_333120 [Lineolata rhizophorae]
MPRGLYMYIVLCVCARLSRPASRPQTSQISEIELICSPRRGAGSDPRSGPTRRGPTFQEEGGLRAGGMPDEGRSEHAMFVSSNLSSEMCGDGPRWASP